MNNPEHGLVKQKEVEPVSIKASLLPPQYLAYKDVKFDDLPLHQYDSLVEYYSKSLAFQLTLEPTEAYAGQNIMALNIGSMEEFRERSETMNFNMGSYVHLQAGNTTYKSVLSNMENMYELSPNRKIMLVFSPESLDDELVAAKEYTLVFNDILFNTGINKFKFYKRQIRDFPEIKIEKILK